MKKNTNGNILDWELFVRVVKLAHPFKTVFVGSTILAVLLAILGPLRPYLIQLTVDNQILAPGGTGQGLAYMSILLIVVLFAESFFRYLFIYYTNWLGQSVIKDLRITVFNHILKLRLRYFDRTPIGTATTRAISDVETINNIFSQGLITIIADLLTIFTIIGIMLFTNWRLALVCLLPIPLLVYSTYVFKESIKGAFQIVRTQVSRINAFLQEHITGMSVVQIFSAEEQEMKKFQALNAELRAAHIRSIWYYSIFFPIVEIISATAIGLLVWYGANAVVGNQTSLGVLIAFILYVNMLFRPMRMLADKFNTLQMGLVASDRIFTLLDRDEQISTTGTLPMKQVKGDISFEQVWFAYDEKNFIIRDVSFVLEAGETLAIVGATGAGKSSVINILNRFYEIQKGTISIDGQSIKNYDLSALRSNIGLVLQDVFLFSGSIYENITLRNSAISREQVMEAAKFVGAHEFIQKLPNQYDYNVMERGATLSLGQRQLVSFIRALVFNPQILILDEATSSVDTETELLVQQAVEKLVQHRTSIVIAHRLSTIRHAHKIMVLDKGQVMELGTHEELMELGKMYKKLHDSQFQTEQTVTT